MRKLLLALVLIVCGSRGVNTANAQSNYEPYSFTTLAGLPLSPGSNDGTGSAARFLYPVGLGVGRDRDVYVADDENNTIRKITPAGLVSTVAGLAGNVGSVDGDVSVARFFHPHGLAVGTGDTLYIADTLNSTIRKITPDGMVSTLAGLAGTIGSADGTAGAARFQYPWALAVDGAGNVYVADSGNNTIRKITPAGVVSTLAGLAGIIGSADGTGNGARFNTPKGVAVDSGGTVYVGDTRNETIRKITPAGVVSTLAGFPGVSGSDDGIGNAARFTRPWHVAVDSGGNIYVADTYGHLIRKLTPAGIVSTLAGSPDTIGDTDGTGSAALFNYPGGMAIDAAGTLYVGDTYNFTIRVGAPTARSQPLNISTRLRVQTDDNALIGGFIVTGSSPKNIILRAIGPSLGNSGVEGFLSDPMLELRDSSGALLASNNNWRDSPNPVDIQATGIAPANDLESAIITTLAPNQGYTAIVRGNGAAAGIALVEAYDLNRAADSILANISTRGFVETGNNVMIGGFILGGGAGGSNVLVRAIGPSLSPGLGNALVDPTLELRDGNGGLISTNDDWKDTNQNAIEATGIPPRDDRESAILATLMPGNYTAIVAGKGGVGVGLVEVYNLR